MIVYLDGQYVDGREARVSIWDGGFLYGDGIYTTLRVYGGRPLDLPAHAARLVRHGAAIDLAVPVDEPALEAIIAGLVERNRWHGRDGRVRITVTRGGDPDRPLPLDRLDTLTPTVLVTLAPLPPDLAAWQADGIGALCLPEGYARGNLPEIKTINGITTLLAQRKAAAAGCAEALLTGPDGVLLEGSLSNLFLVREGAVATPAAAEGAFLAGRTRERVLGLCRELGIPAGEAVLRCADLAGADEVFVASSVREILPVVRIDGLAVGDGRPGAVTRRLQEGYRRKIAAAGPW